MTQLRRTEYDAVAAAIRPAYRALVYNRMPIVQLIATFTLTPKDLVVLRSMIGAFLEQTEHAAQRVQWEKGVQKLDARRLTQKQLHRLENAFEYFLASRDALIDWPVSRYRLSSRDRRYLVSMIRLHRDRLSAAKLAIANVKLIGRKVQLPNTYGLIPKGMDLVTDRRRLAQNDNWLRLLAGKKGMSASAIAYRYRLPIDDATAIRDRATSWRRSCEKSL
jgi:hypothetical protein